MALKVYGSGRVVKKPELETINTRNGEKQLAKLSIAFNNENGEATFETFDIWGKQAENAEKYLDKGSLVEIDEIILNNNYEKDGKKVYGTSFVANKINFLSRSNTKENDELEN